MRRYDIVTGILLILSVIDFAFAAPVLVQEKRQASVDVVNTPRDAITVLGKRGNAELEKLLDEYFKAMGKPAESSNAHVSSSSATNPTWSTANPNRFMEPWGFKPSPITSPTQWGSKYQWLFDHKGDNIVDFSQQNPNKRPSTDMEPEEGIPWDTRLADVKRLSALKKKKIDQTSGYQAEHVQQPAPGPSTPLDFDRIYSPEPVSVVYPPSMSAELPTGLEHEGNPWSNKELGYDVTHGSPSSPELTDPERRSDHQSLSTDSQPTIPHDALYAGKGEAKELRRISGTTGDVGNAVQRELQPDERSLDPSE